MKPTAVEAGGDFVINGTKHFISHADHSDYVILFAATGEETTAHGVRKKMTAFLIPTWHPRFEWQTGYKNASNPAFTTSIFAVHNPLVLRTPLLGARHGGF